MKELIKELGWFKVVEGDKVIYCTNSGPEMVNWIKNQKSIQIQLRDASAWGHIAKVKEPAS